MRNSLSTEELPSATRLQHKVGVNCCLPASWKEVSFYCIIQISFQSFNSVLQEEAEAYFCPTWVLTSFQEFTELQVVFPRSSVGKESACNAGDPGLIPGSRRSPEEGNSYPLQYFCLENSIDRGSWQATVHRVTKSQTWETNTFTYLVLKHQNIKILCFKFKYKRLFYSFDYICCFYQINIW